MNHIVPYTKRYRLPPELQRQVNNYLLLTDTLSEDADPLDRPLVAFDPEAAGAAERMELDRRPASPDVIGQWLTDLGFACNPVAPDVMTGFMRMAIRLLGDLPAFCWNEDTLVLVADSRADKGGRYPSVPELGAMLKPIAARHERELRHLEAMSRAPRPTYARESTVPYKLPPPPEPRYRPVPTEKGSLDPTFHAPKATVDEHVEAARQRLAEVRARRFGEASPEAKADGEP